MVALLPLLAGAWLLRAKSLRQIIRCPKLRCWVVMVGASASAHLFSAADWQVFIGIDSMALLLTLVPPLRCGQKVIATLYIAMISSHVTYGLFLPPEQIIGHNWFNGVLGWMQLVCLAVWSGGDVVGAIIKLRRGDLRGERGASIFMAARK